MILLPATDRRRERYIRTEPIIRCAKGGRPRFETDAAAEAHRRTLDPDGRHDERMRIGWCAHCLGIHVWILPARDEDLESLAPPELASMAGQLLVLGGDL